MLLLSTMHDDCSVNPETKKPEVIEFYNSTKGGVDTFDKMAHAYSVSRGTRRWPLRMFYGVLDQAGINAMILFKSATNPRKYKRRSFLHNLGLALTRPHMQRRLTTNLPRGITANIKEILGIEKNIDDNEPPQKLSKQTRCVICPRTRDKKVKTTCCKCHLPTCSEHRREICINCV